jgi:hypothetical protein
MNDDGDIEMPKEYMQLPTWPKPKEAYNEVAFSPLNIPKVSM